MARPESRSFPMEGWRPPHGGYPTPGLALNPLLGWRSSDTSGSRQDLFSFLREKHTRRKWRENSNAVERGFDFRYCCGMISMMFCPQSIFVIFSTRSRAAITAALRRPLHCQKTSSTITGAASRKEEVNLDWQIRPRTIVTSQPPPPIPTQPPPTEVGSIMLCR